MLGIGSMAQEGVKLCVLYLYIMPFDNKWIKFLMNMMYSLMMYHPQKGRT